MKIDDQVIEFHRLMGLPIQWMKPKVPNEDAVRLRMKLVSEETIEFLEACVSSKDYSANETLSEIRRLVSLLNRHAVLSPKIVEIADALGDIDYVVAGTRLEFGIEQSGVADEIHRSNMAKAPNGIVIRDESGKVMKPEGWTPPDIEGVLRKQGWRP